MDIREALYTTRAMRRVKPDPIPEDVQMRILDAAIRAPSGGNNQNWRFMLVDDPAKREQLGELYRVCIDLLWATIYKDKMDDAESDSTDPETVQMRKIIKSVGWAQDNFASYPLLLFAFDRNDSSGGSIFPAIWSQEQRDLRDPRCARGQGVEDGRLYPDGVSDRHVGGGEA